MAVILAMWIWHKHECHWQKDNHDVFTRADFSRIHTKFFILKAYAYRICVNQSHFGSKVRRNRNTHMHLKLTSFPIEIIIGITKRKDNKSRGVRLGSSRNKTRDGAVVRGLVV